jgi:transposase
VGIKVTYVCDLCDAETACNSVHEIPDQWIATRRSSVCPACRANNLHRDRGNIRRALESVNVWEILELTHRQLRCLGVGDRASAKSVLGEVFWDKLKTALEQRIDSA